MILRRVILALTLLAALPATRAVAQQEMGNLIESKRDCAVCHLEWSSDFEKPGTILLIDKPAISMASRESTCLGCHDGSVRDSRKKVWQEQSHKTGVTPPVSMTVPAKLPLENGKLACRTCHTAHNAPGTEQMGSTFFMRMENTQSQLCRACHENKSGGARHGNHPEATTMPAEFPKTLLAAGARSGPKGAEVICQSCHAAHGAKTNRLLVMPIAENQLCLNCHEALRPGRFAENAGHGHPTRAVLASDVQKKAIVDMGTHSGPGNTLACLSCHRLHLSQPAGAGPTRASAPDTAVAEVPAIAPASSPSPPANQHLLADTLTGSSLCLRCHPGNAIVLDSKHDLRKSAPTARNALNQTPIESGPCNACHMPHQDPRPLVRAPGDPTGLCMDCHAEGKIAANAGAQHFLHPVQINRDRLPATSKLALAAVSDHPDRLDLTCKTCHNPHDASKRRFLRGETDQLCANCHSDQINSLAGSHDFNNHPNAVNGIGQTVAESGKCGFCHNVHRGSGPAMWIATKSTPSTASALCLDCHVAGGLAPNHPAYAFSHPTGMKNLAPHETDPKTFPLPLFDAAGVRTNTNGLVACASCHNPHSDSTKSKRMLRVQGNTSELCLSCHAEKASLAGSIHDSQTNKRWPGNNAGNDLCMACHRAHSNDPKQRLWAIPPASGVALADGICIGCHKQNTWAGKDDEAHRGNMLHPQVMPLTPPEPNSLNTVKIIAAKSPLPLVAPLGSDVRTQIGCATCHNPHATRTTPSLLRTPDATSAQGVCFQCHTEQAGLDGSMHARNLLLRKNNLPGAEMAANSKLLCAPCHAVHAVESSTREKLWAVKLDPVGVTTNEQRCLGCHDNEIARRPEIPRHPGVMFDLVKLTATTRPLNTDGYVPSEQSIPCSVCHLPHGPPAAPKPLPGASAQATGPVASDIPANVLLPTTAPATQPAEAAIDLRRASKPMIRRSVATDLCATCHGSDAGRVFLYYHHPDQRRDVKILQAPPAAPAP